MAKPSRSIYAGIAVLSLCGITAASVSASFPGRNGKLVFSSTRSGKNEIYVMDVRGTRAQRITRTRTADSNPSVSRNGRWIAFERYNRDGKGGTREIYVATITGRKVRRLTRNTRDDAAPTWAPDGRRIAFRSDIDGDPEIYVIDLDTAGVVQLTFNDLVADDDPEFSPDGTRIAFLSRRDGNSEIYVMGADGTAQTRLTADPAVDATPSWSPDGTRIAFESRRGGSSDIWVMNADGSDPRQLTRGSAIERFPAFSPDGRSIVYERRRSSRSRTAIWLMRSDGARQRAVRNLRASNGTPDWQAVRR